MISIVFNLRIPERVVVSDLGRQHDLTADPCSTIAAVICVCMDNDEASAGS
jgi:hypothetical protein